MKYYYVNSLYDAYNSGNWRPQCFVTDKHPFEEVHRLNQMPNYQTVICSWQEITKEEYDLYKKLEDDY